MPRWRHSFDDWCHPDYQKFIWAEQARSAALAAFEAGWMRALSSTENKSMTWDNRYRPLNEGETIIDGDECLTDSHIGWQPATHDIGGAAPNPNYTSHRMYRRRKNYALTAPAAKAPAVSEADVGRKLIEAERARQISEEGWDASHDDAHDNGELLRAAMCYLCEARLQFNTMRPDGSPLSWPWETRWWKPSTPERNFVKGGALLLAERDRLDRAGRPHSHVDHKIELAVKWLNELIQSAAQGGGTESDGGVEGHADFNDGRSSRASYLSRELEEAGIKPGPSDPPAQEAASEDEIARIINPNADWDNPYRDSEHPGTLYHEAEMASQRQAARRLASRLLSAFNITRKP